MTLKMPHTTRYMNSPQCATPHMAKEATTGIGVSDESVIEVAAVEAVVTAASTVDDRNG